MTAIVKRETRTRLHPQDPMLPEVVCTHFPNSVIYRQFIQTNEPVERAGQYYGNSPQTRTLEAFDFDFINAVRGSLLPTVFSIREKQSSSGGDNIMEYNGGAVVAMRGKNCVAIASDKRLGQQFLTLSTEFPKIFPIHQRLFLGMAGLATDVQTLYVDHPIEEAVYFCLIDCYSSYRSELFAFRTELYKLRENREISPKAFAHLVSSTLYSKRFGPYFAEPVIAGLQGAEPFICSTDVIGCLNFAKDFVVAGTAGPSLYGICEALYEPNLEAEDLFECISQALLNAVDRNALSGWGAMVHVITLDKVISRTLKTRQD